MALVKCPECDKEISSIAEACPHCGRPMKTGHRTVEQTSKRLKLQKPLSVLIAIIGLLLVLTDLDGSQMGGVGILLMFIGLIWFFVVAIMVWWKHG